MEIQRQPEPDTKESSAARVGSKVREKKAHEQAWVGGEGQELELVGWGWGEKVGVVVVGVKTSGPPGAPQEAR